MAGKYNFPCDQGATFNRVVYWKQPDGTSPVILTGFTARMQVRKHKSVSSEPPLATLTTENGKISIDGPNGAVSLALSDTDTDAIPAGRWHYDLELKSSGGIVTRLLEGRFVVDAQVTAVSA